MQVFGENLKVVTSDRHGRHFIATLYFAPGEDILNERPLLVTPHWDCQQMKCANCYENSFLMCRKCKFFPLCIDCHDHDHFDCEFFRKFENNELSKDLLVKNYAIFGIIKLLLLLENEEKSERCAGLFEKDIDLTAYRETALWQEQEVNVVAPLLASNIGALFKRIPQLDSDYLHRLCILIDAHAYEVTSTDGDSLKGVYVSASKIPHSCVPNTVVSVDDNFNLKIYAAVTIQHGDVIYNSYANPLMGTSQRQHALRMTRHIDCMCRRCLDPTELGTHMSTMKCKHCEAGFAVCDLGKSGNWICTECHAIIDAIEVHSILAEVGEQLVCANGDVFIYEKLLAKYAPHFHPNHFLLIDIKQNIATILRAILMDVMCNPGRKILERRVQLCEELLPIIRVVTPGISKMYAIALYEYLLSFLELVDLGYVEHDLTTLEFVDNLNAAKDIAATAADLLSFEPANSAEGLLRGNILRELGRIGDKIKRIIM